MITKELLLMFFLFPLFLHLSVLCVYALLFMYTRLFVCLYAVRISFIWHSFLIILNLESVPVYLVVLVSVHCYF